MSKNIIFYDIPSTTPGVPWSPNTWKTRYSLNFKGLPYTTVWVECPDIEATCKKIGALPTAKKIDGSPLYTLPSIYDPSTGVAVSESTEIAIYLDTTYPNTPKLFPPGSHALQRDVLDAHFRPSTMAMLQFTMPAIFNVLNPVSQVFFRLTKEVVFGMTVEELSPKGKRREEEWAKVREEFQVIHSRLPHENGPYIMGSKVSFLDFVVASHVMVIKDLLGEGSKEWNDMKTWNGGRWVALMKNVERYTKIA
ncbi:hypothetical protein BDZ94DRAFT_779256 [Collybia nuda]|uniref:GST N-terminal domain-containing protein n=1 Tax=Collybia nuda TaxID=64659 RepID=A0A9P5YI86_9AGAR|nr:hypothetical protein BDZ94DRAFT_779256 [Collybia nuda]